MSAGFVFSKIHIDANNWGPRVVRAFGSLSTGAELRAHGVAPLDEGSARWVPCENEKAKKRARCVFRSPGPHFAQKGGSPGLLSGRRPKYLRKGAGDPRTDRAGDGGRPG